MVLSCVTFDSMEEFDKQILILAFVAFLPLRVQVPPEKGFNPPKQPQNIFLGGVLTILDP